MSALFPFLAFLFGLALGVGLAAYAARAKITAQTQMADTFKALAADTLSANSASFIQLAESKLSQKTTAMDEMVKPVRETLARMDGQLQALEVKREGAYRELIEMVGTSREAQNLLRQETSQLLQALRAPTARGRWGEIQLERILEMTGMTPHAQDFITQKTFTNDEGEQAIRPDVIVALPGERCVVIDSKVPLTAYLDSVQTSDDGARQSALKQHARQVKDHIKTLGGKAYWSKVKGTPEFVVLFLPGEHFLSAALDADPELMEYCIAQKVVLATPMTLIALLRTVAFGWRQEALRDNVRQIAETGRQLHGLLASFAGMMDQLGSRLNGAVESYNKALRTLEKKVWPKAEKLSEMGAVSSEDSIASPSEITHLAASSILAGGETAPPEALSAPFPKVVATRE